MENEMQLVGLFQQINQKLWKLFSPMFRKEELSITEIFVLMTMRKKETSHVTELAKKIGIPVSTLSGILDRLVLHGFLERSQDPDDRRSIVMTSTPKLKAFIGTLMAPMGDMLKKIFKSMPDSRINRITLDLQFILESLEQKGEKIEQ
jgi:DNA-binding MarR family transcriptional regulator